MAQAAVNPEETKNAYEMYLKAVYPFTKEAKREEDQKLMQRVAKEVAKGPIMFRPVDPMAIIRHTPVQSMPKGVADVLRRGGKPRVLQ